MSLSIDLTTHGKELQQVYDRIISGSADTSWAVFSYDKGNSNELKVQSEGSGELDEIVDEFSDGRVSYGFVRVEDPNTKLNKFVLIGWCGEGVPEHRKGLFHSHFVAVAKFLKGYHVQITARSEADIDPSTIMNKVADSSGSKYSQILSKFETSPKSSRGPPISPSVSAAFGRSSGYRASTINKDDDGWGGTPELKQSAPSTVKTAYVPTKVDMAALRAGKSDTTSSGPEVVKSTYTPIGRVDIAALRAQAQQEDSPQPSYVGTTGYTPVSLPKPKPISSRFGPTVSSTGGTVAPMPSGPKRESKVIGGASKNFGTDASGKTPSQLWAERKARQGGNQPLSVVPDIAPQSPLPRATAPAPTPINSGQYVEDSSDVIGKPSSGGVAAMRERFARQSLEESDRPPISPSMGGRRPSPVTTRPVIEPEEEEEEVSAPPPPPIAISSKPPPARNFQSLDHVVAAGAGAGIGLGVGALASRHIEPEPEEEEEEHPPAHETWDTTQPAEEEDEEDLAARHRAQIHAEQIEEPEPEEEHVHHEEHEQPSAETGAQSAKTAIVLFEYEAQEENEISLIEGQIITNVEFVDEGWWSGESPSGHSGLFPSNYVELQEHDAGDVPAVPLSTSAPAPHEPEPVADEGETAIAEYEYEAQEENELSFPEGARIINIERVDENWWAGEYDGKTGLFPSNYVNAE